MKLLKYSGLDTQGVEKSFAKVVEQLQRSDWASAEVKKLKPTGFYRAKLDYKNRLLFKPIAYQNQTYLLLLEVIRQHAYEKSRFLRGAVVSSEAILEASVQGKGDLESEPVRYLNQQHPNFHFLDKLLSFDDYQEDAFCLPLPLVIIGPAGSGKTALTLEKLKACRGDSLYVTQSAYLVHRSRELYYAANDLPAEGEQAVDFLSYHEFLETLQVPTGQEISFDCFRQWVGQHHGVKVAKDPHKLYEEFKGVLSGAPVEQAYLSQEAYLSLGVKQSIYPLEERGAVYSLYQKYRDWLKKTNTYDLNLISYAYLDKVSPVYDAIVVDEVQDFTNVQLLLLLKSLRREGQFLLCGDSNQIVHPNFFSWSKIKTLFYTGKVAAEHQLTRILHTNYRSAAAITALANQLLALKTARLGSVDKESHYLMQNASDEQGSLRFLSADDGAVRTLNQKTRRSTRHAVIVLRDEQKVAAKVVFDTPLIFSIHEAKGLEYDHIILYDVIAAAPKAFSSLSEGISRETLAQCITYSRVKDKTDRSLEVCKFYINALYVAVTRAVKTLYWVESIRRHPLLDLLDVASWQGEFQFDNAASSREEWQREARKLELQGKHEQAEAIRSQVIQDKPVPWTILTAEKAALLQQKIESGTANKQDKIDLVEYAVVYQQDVCLQWLAESGVKTALKPKKCQDMIQRKYYDPYRSQNINTALQQVARHGVDFRNPFNQTLLMVAAVTGNGTLAKAVLADGADESLRDNRGYDAFQLSLSVALKNRSYAEKSLRTFYRLLAPDSISVQVQERLIKLDQRQMEYWLFYLVMEITNLKPADEKKGIEIAVFSAKQLAQWVQHLPDSVLPPYRKRQGYLSSLLSKNETNRVGPCNRHLFRRVYRGVYQLNLTLQWKRQNQWLTLYQVLQQKTERTLQKSRKMTTAI